MPELWPLDNVMLDDMREIGFCEYGANGSQPLSWATLSAWASLTGARLEGNEVALLRTLSEAYIGQYHAASQEGALPPDHQG